MIRILSMLTLASTMTIATQAQAIFTSPDPLDPTIPGVGTNRYSYSFNDPINGRDPSGYCEESHGCEGEWGPLEGEPSEVQTPDGLQDVSNFGGPNPTYGADPKKFKTENNFDFDKYIYEQILTEGTKFNELYNEALQSGAAVSFTQDWRIGGRLRDFATTSGISLGRLSVEITGTISVGENGAAIIDAVADLSKVGTYDWKPDSDFAPLGAPIGNALINFKGGEYNMPGPRSPNPVDFAIGKEGVDYGRYRDGSPVNIDILRSYHFRMQVPN